MHCKDYTGLGTTWANEIKIVTNHAAGVGSIARPVDGQSSTLSLLQMPLTSRRKTTITLVGMLECKLAISF